MDQVLKMSPQNAVNHYRMGLIRRDMIDLAHAIESFQMAAQLRSQMAEARVELGLALKELKRTDEAIEALKGAVKDFRGAGHSLAQCRTPWRSPTKPRPVRLCGAYLRSGAQIDPKFFRPSWARAGC